MLTSNFITSNTYTFPIPNDIKVNMVHPHNLEYAAPTNKQIIKYMLYLHSHLYL